MIICTLYIVTIAFNPMIPASPFAIVRAPTTASAYGCNNSPSSSSKAQSLTKGRFENHGQISCEPIDCYVTKNIQVQNACVLCWAQHLFPQHRPHTGKAVTRTKKELSYVKLRHFVQQTFDYFKNYFKYCILRLGEGARCFDIPCEKQIP